MNLRICLFPDEQFLNTGELSVLTNLVTAVKKTHEAVLELREDVLQVKRTIMRRNGASSGGIPDGVGPSKLKELPLLNEEDLTATEEILVDNHEVINLTNSLAEVGGSRFSAVCHNIMKMLFHKDLASKYSLQGMRGKKAFNKLIVYKCVIGEIFIFK